MQFSKTYILITVISITFNLFCINENDFLLDSYYYVAKTIKPMIESFSRNNTEELTIGVALYKINVLNVDKISKCDKAVWSELPGELIIRSGIYNYEGNRYSLSEEALYRFVSPEVGNSQRIVYDGDLESLLSSICWIVTHGNTDDGKTFKQLLNKSLHSKLFLTCGSITKFAYDILSELNIKSRIVSGVQIEPSNTFDNGHVFIEIWNSKFSKWVLYDLDNNLYFVSRKDKIPLSFLEFFNALEADQYDISYLSSDIRTDISNFKSSSGYDYGFWMETTNANLRAWYRNIVKVVLIFDETEGEYLFMDDVHKNKVHLLSRHYRYVDNALFMRKFYGNI